MNIDDWIFEENSAARKLLVKYSHIFNSLDANEFVPSLGDFITYESQSVFDVGVLGTMERKIGLRVAVR